MPCNNFLQTLSVSEDDFKRKIISRTLCKESERINCKGLLSTVRSYLPLKLVRRTLIGVGDKYHPRIEGMSYNSARDELFLADDNNKVVRAMRVRDNAGDLRDVYRAPQHTSSYPYIRSVCHMSDSDTLLVYLGEKGPDGKIANWLVALSRNDSDWCEPIQSLTQRVQTEGYGNICCALSDSRVLIGQEHSTYMELFRVESGPRIARVHRIHDPEKYHSFSAMCGSDTLVAMSYPKDPKWSPNSDNSVRVHRLRDDRLEELARIQLKKPERLLWLADRLLVADYDDIYSHAVIQLEVSDTRLERRRELIAISENIIVHRLCAVNDGLAIFDWKSGDILHYSFAENHRRTVRKNFT